MENCNFLYACIVSILISFGNLVKSLTCFNAAEFVSKETGFDATNFWSAKAHDVEQCMVLCVRQKLCKSINYNLKTNVCELNENVRSRRQSKSSENLYSEFGWWPSEVDKDCFSRQCGDDEVCIPGNLGQTAVSGCSYSCMKFGRKVCPLPKEGVSNGRMVGSVNIVKCRKGWTGGGSATCMQNQQWDKVLDKCVEILNYKCKNDTLCSEIEAECTNGKCRCLAGYTYNASTYNCDRQSVRVTPPTSNTKTTTTSGTNQETTPQTSNTKTTTTSGTNLETTSQTGNTKTTTTSGTNQETTSQTGNIKTTTTSGTNQETTSPAGYTQPTTTSDTNQETTSPTGYTQPTTTSDTNQETSSPTDNTKTTTTSGTNQETTFPTGNTQPTTTSGTNQETTSQTGKLQPTTTSGTNQETTPPTGNTQPTTTCSPHNENKGKGEGSDKCKDKKAKKGGNH